MGKVTIDTSITIEVEQSDGAIAVLTLTLEEARALKDELIRAVGAQNPITHPNVLIRTPDTYAPVLTPRGGFTPSTTIPQHLLDRAEVARQRAAQPDTRGGGVLHPIDRPKTNNGNVCVDLAERRKKGVCHCGDPGWGSNGACGTSGCNNVPA